MKKRILICSLLSCGLLLSPKAQSEVPVKYVDAELTVPAGPQERFSDRLIESGEFVNVKKAEWKACRRTRPVLFAEGRDPIEDFLESEDFLTSLQEMERQNLKIKQTTVRPWSGDYWPLAAGVLGSRYQDQDFNSLIDWKSKYDYIQKRPVSRILADQGQSGIPTLSPAEKYDLIVGNPQSAFTVSQWNEGKQYYDESGKVEGWMGICHGWAPAAIMEPRPVKSIEVPSLDRKWKIPLNPSEIKGFVSYSWATNHFPTGMLGDRCNDKKARKDSSGRLVEPQCFDLNPGTWHIATVNAIGRQDRAFVMDATYDYEVWNQPVTGYRYSYFNPKTGEKTSDLAKAIVAKQDWTRDPYRKYRSGKTEKIVGVFMAVSYVIENSATEDATDSEDNDIVRWVEYKYDLELDSKGNIIGGEWHMEAHPDFIWAPRNKVKPTSPLDPIGGEDEQWVEGETVPAKWADSARRGSAEGLILNRITESFLEHAQER